MNILKTNVEHLDTCMYLNDAYKMANKTYFKLRLNSNNKTRYLEIHKELISWIRNYFIFLNEIKSTGVIHPYINIFNKHPLLVDGGKLFTDRRLIGVCLPEKKGKISGSYGEGLVRLLLCQIEGVQEHGVLRVGTSNKAPSPDFVVIDKYLNVLLLAEVKSSIDKKYKKPDRQVKGSRFNGLGINVFFNNKHSKAVNFKIEDPEFEINFDIFSSIYAHMAILEGILLSPNNLAIRVRNRDWAERLVGKFKDNFYKVISSSFTLDMDNPTQPSKNNGQGQEKTEDLTPSDRDEGQEKTEDLTPSDRDEGQEKIEDQYYKLNFADEELMEFAKEYFGGPDISRRIDNKFKYNKLYEYIEQP